MKYQQSSVQDFIRERGLPENTIFKGYVIHLDHSDEFLSQHSNDDDLLLTSWAKSPELAFVFHSHIEAESVCNEYQKNSRVALLFDIGNHLAVL